MGTKLTDDSLPVLLKRYGLLADIVDEEVSRTALQRKRKESRTTVYRGLNQLEEHGYITEEAGKYRPTPAGRLLYKKFAHTLQAEEQLERLRGVFDPSQRIAKELEPIVFREADVVVSERHAPAKTTMALERELETAEQIRHFIPTVSENFFDTYSNKIEEIGFSAELIFSDLALQFLSSERQHTLDSLVESDCISLRRVGLNVPFGLLLVDEPSPRVVVQIHGEFGSLRGIITTSDSAAIGWADERYREYAERSEQYC